MPSWRSSAQPPTYGFSQGALVLSQADPKPTMTFQMLPVAILPTPEANAPSAQATTAVNVRSGPGENYTIYGVLQAWLCRHRWLARARMACGGR